MKRIVKIQKASILKKLKSIKDNNYKKRIEESDRLFLYKHIFGVNKIEIGDSEKHPDGKSIYVHYMDGTVSHISTADIVSRKYFI